MGNCSGCKFFRPIACVNGEQAPTPADYGACGRYPPFPLPIAAKTEDKVQWGHPPRHGCDGCGEFIPKQS